MYYFEVSIIEPFYTIAVSKIQAVAKLKRYFKDERKVVLKPKQIQVSTEPRIEKETQTRYALVELERQREQYNAYMRLIDGRQ